VTENTKRDLVPRGVVGPLVMVLTKRRPTVNTGCCAPRVLRDARITGGLYCARPDTTFSSKVPRLARALKPWISQ
jgi:hypothetical protein